MDDSMRGELNKREYRKKLKLSKFFTLTPSTLNTTFISPVYNDFGSISLTYLSHWFMSISSNFYDPI